MTVSFLTLSPPHLSFSSNQAVQDVLGLLEIELRENSISVQLDLAPSLPPVSADLIQNGG